VRLTIPDGGTGWSGTSTKCVKQRDGRRQGGKEKGSAEGLKDKVREREAKEREKEKDKPIPAVDIIEPVGKSEPRRQNETGPRKLGGSTGQQRALPDSHQR